MNEVKKLGENRNFVGDTIEDKIEFFKKSLNRDIKWSLIKALEDKGEDRTCEICGMKGKGGYFCEPCIHRTWCCECCILLGIPNYSVAMYAIGTSNKESGD